MDVGAVLVDVDADVDVDVDEDDVSVVDDVDCAAVEEVAEEVT